MSDYFYGLTALVVHHVVEGRDDGRLSYSYCEGVLWTALLLQGEDNQ